MASSASHTPLTVDAVEKNQVSEETWYQYGMAVKEIIRWLKVEANDLIGPPTQADISFGLDHSIVKEGFTAEVFKNFLCTQKVWSKSKQRKTAERKRKRATPISGSGEPVDMFQSHQTMSRYRSAIQKYFQMKKSPLSSSWCSDTKAFFDGIKRTHAQYREQGWEKISIGKDELKFVAYKQLARDLIRSSPMSHAYLVVCWNLISRVSNIANLRSANFQEGSVNNDTFVVQFAKTKSDQVGSRTSNPKSMYANPLHPEICPYLALAIHLAVTKDTKEMGPSADSEQSRKIFPGSSQSKRFTETLKRILADSDNPQVNDDIAGHSVRKGAFSYCSSISTDGPAFGALCLRAGWSLGVQDRYLRHVFSGDNVVGRFLSGLPTDCVDFAMLPPHFKEIDDNVNTARRETFKQWDTQEGICRVLNAMLASLVYHATWLKDNLPESHPIHFISIFRSNSTVSLVQLKDNLCVCDNGTPPLKRCEHMSASGVPTSINVQLTQHTITRLW